VRLLKFLHDDLRRGLWVQEKIAEDLAYDLVRAAVIGSGSAFLRLESGHAPFPEKFQQLIVTLTAVAVFGREGGGIMLEALAFHEHEEPTG
jgi:hypothetical protein